MEHHAVEDFACGCAGYVVGKNVLHKALGILAPYEHFAHVADIEYAAGMANGIVLIRDIGVLKRHFKTAEGNDFRSQLYVLPVEACSFV